MSFSIVFFANSVLLGIGLAMDAFSVSLVNGLNEPDMKKRRMSLIALVFAFFQAAMPLIGWVCVHTMVTLFSQFEKFIPYIALILLAFIGTKMLLDGKSTKEQEKPKGKVTAFSLFIQGIATSIDALSVGFTIADYDIKNAVLCALIIAVVTFSICLCGVAIGKKFGTKLSKKAYLLGGVILIAVGIEIFITGVF